MAGVYRFLYGILQFTSEGAPDPVKLPGALNPHPDHCRLTTASVTPQNGILNEGQTPETTED